MGPSLPQTLCFRKCAGTVCAYTNFCTRAKLLLKISLVVAELNPGFQESLMFLFCREWLRKASTKIYNPCAEQLTTTESRKQKQKFFLETKFGLFAFNSFTRMFPVSLRRKRFTPLYGCFQHFASLSSIIKTV